MDEIKESFFYRWSWLAGLIGTLCLLCLSAPGDLQITARRLAPYGLREYLLTVSSLDKWALCFYAFTVLTFAWGSLGLSFQNRLLKKHYKSVNATNEELRSKVESTSIDCYDFFSRFLVGYYAHLKMTVDERVSLYLHDGNRFLCIARYSSNEIYRRKPSKIYEIDKGCLSKAWERNKYQDSKSPDPDSDSDGYTQYQIDNFGYSQVQLSEMRMKSRSYNGIRIKNPSNESIAVLLFESTKPSGLPFGKIDRLVNLEEQRRLGALINSLEVHMPKLANAEQEGF